MNDETKPLAKSLHTVSVLVALGRALKGPGKTDSDAVNLALEELGLNGRADPYGLAAAAVKAMGKSAS